MSSKKGWLLLRLGKAQSKSSGPQQESRKPSASSPSSTSKGAFTGGLSGLTVATVDAPSGFSHFFSRDKSTYMRIAASVSAYKEGKHPRQDVFDSVVDLLLRAQGYDPVGMDRSQKAGLVTIINDTGLSDEQFADWYQKAFELTL